MLHHYNYTTSLSHFLSYHQLDDQNLQDGAEHGVASPSPNILCDELSQQEDPRCRSNSSATNKSFTIAAILGLKNNNNNGSSNKDANATDNLNAVNLSADRSLLVSGYNRLQLPVHGHGSVSSAAAAAAAGVTGHYTVGHGCSSVKQSSARGLKHLSHSSAAAMQTKKNCKSKRVRTIFTPEQLERLEAEFERQQYMVGPERLYLAHTLQLTEAQVKVWFQNRRIKWRKHHLELTHQRLAVLKQQQLLLDESNPDVQDTNSSSTTDNT